MLLKFSLGWSTAYWYLSEPRVLLLIYGFFVLILLKKEILVKIGLQILFLSRFLLKDQDKKLNNFVLDFIVCSWPLYPLIFEEIEDLKRDAIKLGYKII